MLDKPCSLASASVFGTFLKGGILAPFLSLNRKMHQIAAAKKKGKSGKDSGK
jgi:hypothetical protein